MLPDTGCLEAEQLSMSKEWGCKSKTVCSTNGSLDLTSFVQYTHREMSHEANKHK